MVTITFDNGKSVEIDDDAFRVLWAAMNWIVDSGDAYSLFADDFPKEVITRARSGTGSIAEAAPFTILEPPFQGRDPL
jgi:hypothetical protein